MKAEDYFLTLCDDIVVEYHYTQRLYGPKTCSCPSCEQYGHHKVRIEHKPTGIIVEHSTFLQDPAVERPSEGGMRKLKDILRKQFPGEENMQQSQPLPQPPSCENYLRDTEIFLINQIREWEAMFPILKVCTNDELYKNAKDKLKECVMAAIESILFRYGDLE
jgi:hypothetical protein